MKNNHALSSSSSWSSKETSWSSKEEVSLAKIVLYLVARWFLKNTSIHFPIPQSVGQPASMSWTSTLHTHRSKWSLSLSFFLFVLVWLLTRKSHIIHSTSNSCIMIRCTSNDHLWDRNEKWDNISDLFETLWLANTTSSLHLA